LNLLATSGAASAEGIVFWDLNSFSTAARKIAPRAVPTSLVTSDFFE
jgi:hypothetical protein